jgi:phospholipid transport system substrate-binding protein
MKEMRSSMKLKIFIMMLFIISMGIQNAWSGADQIVPDSVTQAGTPAKQVRGILEEVMAIQTSPQIQGATFRDQQREAIKRIIGQNFHFEAMAKKALDTYWNKLNGADRLEFKSIFQELFQESYTKLVLDFLKREKILYTDERIDYDQAVVKTKITRLNEDIPVDYFLSLVQGHWLVEDVAIDGVSIIGNYQRSFSRVIKKESYASLLKKMRLQQKAIEKPL